MNADSIAHKIIRLKREDLQLRAELIRKGRLFNGYDKEMEKLHNRNAEILNDIINVIGYPTIDKVGEEASEAAWLVIQHAIGQPAFMKKCRGLLEKAVSEMKADPVNLAYLTDRIAVLEGKPQLYGTQFDWDENGALSPNYFDDLAKLNQRRTSIGLNTLEEQTALMKQQAASENQAPPEDFDKRRYEMDEWRRKAGWIK